MPFLLEAVNMNDKNIKRIYMIVAKDGRVFFEEASDVTEVLDSCAIPIKAIYDGREPVWEDR